jgi:hypothetical protein
MPQSYVVKTANYELPSSCSFFHTHISLFPLGVSIFRSTLFSLLKCSAFMVKDEVSRQKYVFVYYNIYISRD